MNKPIIITILLLFFTVSVRAQQMATKSVTDMKDVTLSVSGGYSHPIKNKSGLATRIPSWAFELERTSWQTPYKGTSIGLKFSSLGYGFDYTGIVDNVTEKDHFYYIGIPLSYKMRANADSRFIYTLGLRPDYLVSAKAIATDGNETERVDAQRLCNPCNLTLFARVSFMVTKSVSVGAHVEFNAIPVIKNKYASTMEKTNMWNLMLTLGYRR